MDFINEFKDKIVACHCADDLLVRVMPEPANTNGEDPPS